MGRVLRTISGARLRYFSANAGVCSLKFALDCGRPASRRATFSPDSARRLHAQPPEAPEPTTITSYFCVVDSAKGSIPPKTMIAHPKQCHDLRMLTSQAERGQSKRMSALRNGGAVLSICFVAGMPEIVSRWHGTCDRAAAECYHYRENLLHN